MKAPRKFYKARPVVQKITSPNGTVYDSKLEQVMHEGVLSEFQHHPAKIGYVVPHMYNPDFQLDNILIETKGFFSDSAEASKYKWIREHLDEGQELVFIFEKPDAKLSYAKKRKDGTKMTHKEWATKNGFRAYGTDVTIEEILG
jgi:hypothetical protein